MILPRLHLVTNESIVLDDAFHMRAATLLEALGPAVALHLRGHGVSGRTFHAVATRLAPVARAAGAMLLANDRVDIALIARLDGVQLGQRSVPVHVARALLPDAARIGYSAHGSSEAAAAAADFVVLGTVFESPSHPGRPGCGVARLADAARVVTAPLIAIGGITTERVTAALRAGAYGVAVLSGVWSDRDPVASALAYADAVHAAVPVPS